MKKILLFIGLILLLISLLNINLISAHENFTETKKLIDSGISCNNLTNEQLEEMGDYYMEQMHPGESHEMMHKMMGGEDSETTKLMHINMAKSIYCGEGGMTGCGSMMGGGMMNMMGGTGGGGMMNMMGGNMMQGMMGEQTQQTNMMRGMMGMGNVDYNFGYWSFVNVFFITFFIGLIILVYLLIIKLWKNMEKRGKNEKR